MSEVIMAIALFCNTIYSDKLDGVKKACVSRVFKCCTTALVVDMYRSCVAAELER